MANRIRIWLPMFMILMILLPLLLSSSDSPLAPHLLIYKADHLYRANQFSQAAQLYEQVLTRYPVFSFRYPALVLKIANAFLISGQPNKAVKYLEHLRTPKYLLNDYRLYFLARSHILNKDSTQALLLLGEIRHRYPDSPLLPLVDSLRASLFDAASRLDSAYAIYLRLRNISKFDRSQIYFRLFTLARVQHHQRDMLRIGFQFLKKFPFHPDARVVFDELRKMKIDSFSSQQISAFIDFLFTNRQFTEARSFLASLRKAYGRTEFIRWKQIELKYQRGYYSQVIKDYKTQRKFFKSLKYLREMDLYLARALLRKGDIQQAIHAYLKFQQRYPRDRLSPEVLWKIAWLYEEMGDIRNARKFYSRLIARYPHSQFVSEARFRLGLSFYREGDYANSRNLLTRFRKKEKDASQKDRLSYWIAKSYYQLHAYRKYFSELKELGKTPFHGYYNFKSFLLTREDQSLQHSLDSLVWELHHQQESFLPEYQSDFRRALIVKEIFGEKYAAFELSALYRKQKSTNWQFLFALGELNEKIQDYGRAFRIFRSIYLNQFQDTDFQQWQFLLKQLYPLYFMENVLQASRKWHLNPALTLAIMKKESAFESRIISYANAYGLMQLIPPTAREVSRRLEIEFNHPQELFDPSNNIQMGTYYISKLIQRYQGNLYYALAAYNAGPHRVEKWRKIFNTADDELFMENIEFEQTRNYVRTVLYYYWVYQLFIFPQQLPDQVLPYPEKLTANPAEKDSATHPRVSTGIGE